MIICPRCGQENSDNARNCSECHVNLKYALENAEEYIAKQQVKDLERQAKELELQKYKNLIITTTPSIEGKTISQYLGIVSSAVVLGTGFGSELLAGVADFLGTRSGAFQGKLNEAREMVLTEMKSQAAQRMGDGIVGISLDYMTFQGNMIMVSGSGTVVGFSTQEGMA